VPVAHFCYSGGQIRWMWRLGPFDLRRKHDRGTGSDLMRHSWLIIDFLVQGFSHMVPRSSQVECGLPERIVFLYFKVSRCLIILSRHGLVLFNASYGATWWCYCSNSNSALIYSFLRAIITISCFHELSAGPCGSVFRLGLLD
jgi:hypothetical protein